MISDSEDLSDMSFLMEYLLRFDGPRKDLNVNRMPLKDFVVVD